MACTNGLAPTVGSTSGIVCKHSIELTQGFTSLSDLQASAMYGKCWMVVQPEIQQALKAFAEAVR